tara:strand:- start:2782 stop:3279 length:498 start_codon:yes stop_codon:yes gene_type:complete
MSQRTCKACGISYEEQNLKKEKLCRTCRSAKRNEYKRKNHPATKSQQLQFKYGITWDDYMSMMEKQNSLCAVCNAPAKINTYGYPVLAVDHCHATGKVRGLLCDNCNKAAGLLFDKSNYAVELCKYLAGHCENKDVEHFSVNRNQRNKHYWTDYMIEVENLRWWG